MMNKEDVIELARKAGFQVGPSRDGPDDVWGVVANLDRLAKLIAEKERDDLCKYFKELEDKTKSSKDKIYLSGVQFAIRARGQE